MLFSRESHFSYGFLNVSPAIIGFIELQSPGDQKVLMDDLVGLVAMCFAV